MEIERLRKERNLTQHELAGILGVSQGAISMIELGQRKPSYDLLIHMADYFGVSLDELIKRKKE